MPLINPCKASSSQHDISYSAWSYATVITSRLAAEGMLITDYEMASIKVPILNHAYYCCAVLLLQLHCGPQHSPQGR